jgi:UPF0755 protein
LKNPLSTLIKIVVFFGVICVFIGAVGLGFLFIVSGGDIMGFAQTTMLRLSLSSRQDELEAPIGTDPTPRRFTINSGDSAFLIARNLDDAGLISDAQLFVDYLRLEKLDTQLESGTYFLNQTQNIPQIAQVLIDVRNSGITFTLMEGTRIEEVADAIDANGRFGFRGTDFLPLVAPNAVIDSGFATTMGIPAGASLEGFLFPDTYVLPPEITAEQLRDTLLEAFQTNAGAQLLVDANSQGLSMRDAVSLASIVEREAVWNDEHPLIASVYRNRLELGMRLDADPTIQYALNGGRGGWWPRISSADYRGVISPYNTYLNDGLPPSPIANPGISALRAAIYPVESSYYYFRARCDGSNYHSFAATYEQHVANGC